MAIVRKGGDAGQPKKKIVSVDRYDIPEVALNLVGQICSTRPSADIDKYYDSINQGLFSKENVDIRNIVENFVESHNKANPDEIRKYNRNCSLEAFFYLSRKYTLYEIDFFQLLKDKLLEIASELQVRENTKHTQVVVAGGFSAGKSSFLNTLTGCKGLLPTGIEPVSVIKTYLYCNGKGIKANIGSNQSVNNIFSKYMNSIQASAPATTEEKVEVKVKGVNLKNAVVDLDESVLKAIQHSSKSKVYLTSVLDKLFVEIQSSKLDGLVFIDTPGYNKEETKNEGSGKTDKEVAESGLDEGNVLFWLIDCERGTISDQDLKMIEKFEGKKVIIFNKADKKGPGVRDIVEGAAINVYRNFPKEDIIDVLGYSALDDKVYYSKNGYHSMSQIIDVVKQTGDGTNRIEELKNEIKELFDDEIQYASIKKSEYENKYKELADIANSRRKGNRDNESYREDLLESIREVILDGDEKIDGYDDLMKRLDEYQNISANAINTLNDLIARAISEEQDHTFSHDSWINSLAGSWNDKWKKLCDRHNNNLHYTCYNQEWREKLCSYIKDAFEELKGNDTDSSDEISSYKDDASKCITGFMEHYNAMSTFKRNVIAAIDRGIADYTNSIKNTSSLEKRKIDKDIFEVIDSDNLLDFKLCVSEGIDLNSFNKDGYNPLTYAVKSGNNEMVKFLLDAKADPSVNDNRGMNAFLTAVENQYRDMCEILLDYDEDLVNTTTSNKENAQQLAEKNMFLKWVNSGFTM